MASCESIGPTLPSGSTFLPAGTSTGSCEFPFWALGVAGFCDAPLLEGDVSSAINAELVAKTAKRRIGSFMVLIPLLGRDGTAQRPGEFVELARVRRFYRRRNVWHGVARSRARLNGIRRPARCDGAGIAWSGGSRIGIIWSRIARTVIAGIKPARVGGSGTCAAGIRAAGVGSTGVGSTGVGSTGVGSTGAGAARTARATGTSCGSGAARSCASTATGATGGLSHCGKRQRSAARKDKESSLGNRFHIRIASSTGGALSVGQRHYFPAHRPWRRL